MEQNEHIRDFMTSLTGNSLTIQIVAVMKDEGDWEANGAVTFGGTRNGKDWGKVTKDAKALDDNPNSATATLMLSFTNYLHSLEFYEDLIESILNHEQLDTEEGKA